MPCVHEDSHIEDKQHLRKQLNRVTDMLCQMCGLYYPQVPKPIQEWYEKHLEADERREKAEKLTKAKKARDLRDAAAVYLAMAENLERET